MAPTESVALLYQSVTVRRHLSPGTMISILYFISSLSAASIPVTNLCQQSEIEIQPNLLQNDRGEERSPGDMEMFIELFAGEFKCLEQDIENRCEDILNMDHSHPPHRAQLNNQTLKISVCHQPGSSCLGCQDPREEPQQEAVCTQVFRTVKLSVLKDNYEEFELDTFSLPDGCECSLTTRQDLG